MPRPHIPSHLSLSRVKQSVSGSYTSKSRDNSAPSTPYASSKNPSPNRSTASLNGATAKSPGMPGEGKGDHMGMGLVLTVEALKGRTLAAKDKSGTSDPFLVLTLGDSREATSVVSKTLNPQWNQRFEFPVTTSDAALLEVVCWDKDRFRNDYMGEFDVVLEDLFAGGKTDPDPKWITLESRRTGGRKKKDANVTGEVLLKFSIHDPINSAATPHQVLQKFLGVVAPPEDEDDEDDEELLARLRSQGLDDAGEEDDEEKESSGDSDSGTRTPSGATNEKRKRRRRDKLRRLRRRNKLKAFEFTGMSDVAGVLFLEINRLTDLPPEKNSTRTSFDMDPFVVTSLGKKTYRTKVIRHDLNPVFDEKLVFQVQKHEVNYKLNFAVVDRDKFSGNDFVGTTTFPIQEVKDLSPEDDPTTGLYKLPDPEDVAEGRPESRRRRFRMSMSRTTSQRTISRHGSSQELNKLTRTTSGNSLKNYTNPSRPKLRSEGSEGDLAPPTPRPGPTSYPSQASAASVVTNKTGNGNATPNANDEETVSDDPEMYSYELPLQLKNASRWHDKHKPMLYIKAKYLPYRALRQQFWRAMLKQYDADESGKIDKVEMITMLDTLGSTLHNKTIDGFFRRFQQENGGEKVLTFDQAVICLEEQLTKSRETQQHEKSPHWRAKQQRDPQTSTAHLTKANSSSPSDSPGGITPELSGSEMTPANLNPKATDVPALQVSDLSTPPATDDAQTDKPTRDLLDRTDSWDQESEADLTEEADAKEEHVVEIQECPICHMPRLERSRHTTDADIITHIATCASSDWRAVNNLVMGGFVTSSQAQRKWYSKVVTKIGYGGYKLGANSANILVQDRGTGMINEERMSVYVRLGIRLLYKGLKSRDMEKKRIRRLLRSLSLKQGRKYDDPASASQIPSFINFHQLDMSEVLLPTSAFKTFNEFFYRKLKPHARPCSAPTNPHIVVSPADCRTVVYDRLEIAQRIWVKGREFSPARLLADAYPQDAKRYRNGSLGVFRLAPQDYHRFHIPVDGVMGAPKLVEGEYYTVNPMAIRSALDVYGENVRVVVPIDSEVHGRVMVVCVGAMMVGSTVITRTEGETVKRGEELGFFKFGGSTLLVLAEEGKILFDDDLVRNSEGALETLVRVGMSIGHSPSSPQHHPDQPKANPSSAEKQEAKRRIEGSLAPSKIDAGGLEGEVEGM